MVFAAMAVFLFVVFPDPIMSLTTDSQQVIDLGANYLVASSASMFAVACVASMAVGLRAMHQPGLSTFFSGIGIVSNVFLNWVLIFGHLGFPALGITGAAIATVISGAIEVGCLFGYLWAKKHILAFGWNDIRAGLVFEKLRAFLVCHYLRHLTFWHGLVDYLFIMRLWDKRASRAWRLSQS